MSLEAVRAAIVARLRAVPGVGVVHDHERYVADQEGLAALYVSGAQLLGWYVRRLRSLETSPALGRYVETTAWRIQGFMGLADADSGASELAFDALIESIREAFRTDETLGGMVASTVTDDAAGIQVEQSGPVMFCGHLCHGATLSLTTTTYR